jgi:hypothetical protein
MLVMHSTLARMDKGPKLGVHGEEELSNNQRIAEMRALTTYKRIVCLQNVDRCGMCGTKRHQTKPFWHLGKRICKYCVQKNLVSNLALEETYWLNVWKGPTSQDQASFIDQIIGRVWYFKEYCAARARSEYTIDRADFQSPEHSKKSRLTWFFWRPHLEAIFDFKALSLEAAEKVRQAATVKGYVRRALALRTLASAGDRKRPTRMIEWSKQEDKRAPLFKLQRLALMENAVRPAPKCLPELSRKLSDFEDRLTLQPNACRAQFGLQLAAKALDSAGFYGGCGP